MLNRFKWLNIFVLTALVVIFSFMTAGGVSRVYYMRITPLFQLVAIPLFISSGLYIAFSFAHAYKERVFSLLYLYQVVSLIMVLIVLFFIPEIYILFRRWVQIVIMTSLVINQVVMVIMYDKRFDEDGSYILRTYDVAISTAKKAIDVLNHHDEQEEGKEENKEK